MSNSSQNESFNKIRTQIEFLKERLENIDKTLEVQEEVLDLLYENSKSLLHDALYTDDETVSVNEIMKRAFSGKALPKILFKK